jgi:SAM-dependent methyltransferase
MFKFRSEQKELLDADQIPETDLFRNLSELDFINHWLGGYRISFSALKMILEQGRKYSLVDIGSGGGDTLKRINTWRKNKRFELDLFGVDIKPVCINYSRSNLPDPEIHFICDDYRNMYNHFASVDIIHACLFCHHLTENELVDLIRFSSKNGAILIVNDLERNALAYYLIKILTAVFSKSYLVKNDAPLSVWRGFKRKEWKQMLKLAGAGNYSLKNKWAFRHQIIVYPD